MIFHKFQNVSIFCSTHLDFLRQTIIFFALHIKVIKRGTKAQMVVLRLRAFQKLVQLVSAWILLYLLRCWLLLFLI